MTADQRTLIRTGYLIGLTTERIASLLKISSQDAEVYLTWWCDRGCPSTRDDV